MMQKIYILLALIIFCFALRSCKTTSFRKLGALCILIFSGLSLYFLTDSIILGILGILAWFFLPWVELLTRIRKMRIPTKQELQPKLVRNLQAYPSAEKYLEYLEDAEYEHVSDCGWNLCGVDHIYRLFWNAETRSVATLCLCEQSHVSFAYLSITSKDITDNIYRTTNFPFSPTMKPNPLVTWNQISCTIECTHKLLENHCLFLEKEGFVDDDLAIPDPDQLEQEIEREIQAQIEYNLKGGILTQSEDETVRYTAKGLFFLWSQFMKDMVRLC